MAFQGDSIFWVEVEKIVPNPFQPRREFDEAKLKELAESVRMYGILQPMTVTRREVPNDDGSFRTEYELIAGERRLRASKLAGVTQVPVIIRDGEQSEQEKLELAIIENLQREDLNAVDRALAFRQLADVFALSHSQVAKKVGRSREYVSNSIRILALPDYMLDAVRSGDISEGHARTLLMLNDRPEEQDTVFRETMLKKLSVREVERIARGIATERVRKKESIDSDLLDLEKQFTETLGTRVSIVKTEFGGRLTIDYFSPDELQVMLTKMRDEQAATEPNGANAVVAALAATTPLETFSVRRDESDQPLETDSVSDDENAIPAPAPATPEVSTPHESATEPEPTVTPAATVLSEAEMTIESESTIELPVAPPLSEKLTHTPPTESVEKPTEEDVSFAHPPTAEKVTPPAPASPPAPTEQTQPPQAPSTDQSAPSLSLRDQLHQILHQKTNSVPPTPPPSTTDNSTYTTPPPPNTSDDDDSDLYSMKNFTV